MKVIKVEALRRDNYPNRCRADRFWPGGEAVSVEVLDQENDWRTVHEDGSVTFDPETSIEIEHSNPTTGIKTKQRRPHPTRIGQSAYREILTDSHLRIMEGGELSSQLSQAALEAARKQAAGLASQLVDAKSELASAAEREAKLEAIVADLTAKLAAVAPVAPTSDQPAPAEPETGKKGGKAK